MSEIGLNKRADKIQNEIHGLKKSAEELGIRNPKTRKEIEKNMITDYILSAKKIADVPLVLTEGPVFNYPEINRKPNQQCL